MVDVVNIHQPFFFAPIVVFFCFNCTGCHRSSRNNLVKQAPCRIGFNGDQDGVGIISVHFQRDVGVRLGLPLESDRGRWTRRKLAPFTVNEVGEGYLD